MSFVSKEANQDGTVYSNAKTSFYSNMQQSASHNLPQVPSPHQTNNRMSLGTGSGFAKVDLLGNSLANNPQTRQFTSGGFNNFSRPIATMTSQN